MRVNRCVNRALVFSTLMLLVLTLGSFAGAQEEEAAATAVSASIPATDSLAMAPNDSTVLTS